MNLDPILDQSIDAIQDRLSDIELEYAIIAGKRLNKILNMTNEQLKDYLYSADYLDDSNTDLNKVKRLMNKANRENIKTMKTLAKEIIDETIPEVV
jgi:hypothetical protein